MKVYKVAKYTNEIKELEADRVTEKTVWINGRRNRKSGYYYEYFTTKEEAVLFLRDRLVKEIKSIENRLLRAKQALSDLEKES